MCVCVCARVQTHTLIRTHTRVSQAQSSGGWIERKTMLPTKAQASDPNEAYSGGSQGTTPYARTKHTHTRERARVRTHTHTHARAHTYTHTHTHTHTATEESRTGTPINTEIGDGSGSDTEDERPELQPKSKESKGEGPRHEAVAGGVDSCVITSTCFTRLSVDATRTVENTQHPPTHPPIAEVNNTDGEVTQEAESDDDEETETGVDIDNPVSVYGRYHQASCLTNKHLIDFQSYCVV